MIGERAKGLVDGFECYLTPTTDDLRLVLTKGMVVVDANVLLNLYRYTVEAREDLLTVLERLGDRLWVPHQAVVEFWRNRETVLRDPKATGSTVSQLQKCADQAAQALQTWANRVSLDRAQKDQLVGSLTEAFDVAASRVRELADEDPEAWSQDTEADPILGRLRQVLAGRVGPPLGDDDYQAALKEAHRRIEKKEPPGYKDSAKDGDLAAGDYLVWEQTLREAERQTCDVLFVTGDGKEDWWRDSGGQRRGPRVELAHELRERAGTRLFMMRPTGLLVDANRHLDVPVREESLGNVDAFDRILDADMQRLQLDGGWSVVALRRLLARLEREAPVQAATIKAAAAAGGVVDRDKVYELGDYEPTRLLRGFTRPVTRISQDLKNEGMVHVQAVDVLVTRYDPQAQDFGWATGFEVPEVLLANLAAALEEMDNGTAHSRDESVSGHPIDPAVRTRE